MTIRTGGVHRYPLPRAFCRAFRHILTHCAHSQHFDGSRSDCQKYSIKSSLLTFFARVQRKPQPRLDNLVTIFALAFFCVLTPRCLAFPPQSNTGYEPNSEIDVAGSFVPILDLPHDDGDTNSHMSLIPLQLLRGCQCLI